MDARNLYQRIDADFELENCNEPLWDALDLGSYITERFRKTCKGLVLDNTEVIEKVYTAVFPSEEVIGHLLSSEESDILLFTHHPMIWDTSLDGLPFRNIPHSLLEELQEQRISHYAIHVPLDKVGPYSTSISLAKALGIEPEQYFFEYFGFEVGVIGKTSRRMLSEFTDDVRDLVGHNVKMWKYGSEEINESRVAIVAGGGNEPDIALHIAEAGINTYLTGITRIVKTYEPSVKFHEICRENAINVVAATHYSTEKFACIALLDYFNALGIPCEFIEDKPSLDDL